VKAQSQQGKAECKDGWFSRASYVFARRAIAVRGGMVAFGVPSTIATSFVQSVHVIYVAAVICVLFSTTLLVTLAAVFARRIEQVDIRVLSCTCFRCAGHCLWCNPLFFDNEDWK
jgi:hypothetical protein